MTRNELTIRLMAADESDLIADYFHGATPEHLEMLGVDPTRLPDRVTWGKRLAQLFALPVEQRTHLLVVWLANNRPFGFSTADRIAFGERASMHLHILDVKKRNQGYGARCARESIDIYFDNLRLKRLFCEPNAFNVAPNRTLQKAGFTYVKTHMTVPGPLNFHQAVNQWVIER